MPFGLAWSEATLATRREVAMPMEQLSCVSRFHRLVQLVGGGERRSVQALGAGDVEVGLVDRGHFHLRREAIEHFADACASSRGSAPDVRR